MPTIVTDILPCRRFIYSVRNLGIFLKKLHIFVPIIWRHYHNMLTLDIISNPHILCHRFLVPRIWCNINMSPKVCNLCTWYLFISWRCNKNDSNILLVKIMSFYCYPTSYFEHIIRDDKHDESISKLSYRICVSLKSMTPTIVCMLFKDLILLAR